MLAVLGLDYKQLMDRECDPLKVLTPAITADNINVLANLAAKIPGRDGGYLQPSVVYCGWALQCFWQGLPSSSGKQPQNMVSNIIVLVHTCSYVQSF